MAKINPCRYCRSVPTCGYYPGDFAIECNDCCFDLCRHMIDFPAKTFKESAALAKADAIKSWNIENPKGQTSGT